MPISMIERAHALVLSINSKAMSHAFASLDPPGNFNIVVFQSLLKGARRYLPEPDYNWLNSILERRGITPEKAQEILKQHECIPYITICAATRKALKAEKIRTDHSSYRLLKGRTDLPERFHSTLIEGWISGRVKSARTDALTYVLDAYAALPTVPKAKRTLSGAIKERVLVDEEIRDAAKRLLAAHPAGFYQNAPLSPTRSKLRQIAGDKPVQVPAVLARYLLETSNRLGSWRDTDKPPPDLFPGMWEGEDRQYAPSLMRRLNVAGEDYDEVSENDFHLLHAEISRTGVSPGLIFKWYPEELKIWDRATLTRVLAAKQHFVAKGALSKLKALYAALPSQK